MHMKCFIIFGLAALFRTAATDEIPSNSIGEILLSYEKYITASLKLDRSDRSLLAAWATEFLLKQVNITSQYRLDMTRHREHSFRGMKNNPKWKECISLHQRQINKCKSSYMDSEAQCVTTASSADTEKVKAVHQLEKEIKKWRKSYRYLSNLCASNNPDDQDAASVCLVEYVKRDNYDAAFQRLLILKLEAMENVLLRINQALWELEECLKLALGDFLDSVRKIMATLNTCYSTITRE